MKELVRDRIDVLMDKARAGSARAQLKLAKWFYKGHLVEKSTDSAKYWAFKAMVGGNGSAADFYQAVVDNKSYTHFRISRGLLALTVVELLCGVIILSSMPSDSDKPLVDRIWGGIGMAFIGFGLLALAVVLFKKIGKSLLGKNGAELGVVIGLIGVHVLVVYIALKQTGVL